MHGWIWSVSVSLCDFTFDWCFFFHSFVLGRLPCTKLNTTVSYIKLETAIINFKHIKTDQRLLVYVCKCRLRFDSVFLFAFHYIFTAAQRYYPRDTYQNNLRLSGEPWRAITSVLQFFLSLNSNTEHASNWSSKNRTNT